MAELCNGLSIPRALALFVLAGDIRESVELDGVKNGVNLAFTIPNGEKAIHAPPGLQLKFYRNGMRQRLGASNDFTVSESGGAGTGVDTITVVGAPLTFEVLLVDFVVE